MQRRLFASGGGARDEFTLSQHVTRRAMKAHRSKWISLPDLCASPLTRNPHARSPPSPPLTLALHVPRALAHLPHVPPSRVFSCRARSLHIKQLGFTAVRLPFGFWVLDLPGPPLMRKP